MQMTSQGSARASRADRGAPAPVRARNRSTKVVTLHPRYGARELVAKRTASTTVLPSSHISTANFGGFIRKSRSLWQILDWPPTL